MKHVEELRLLKSSEIDSATKILDWVRSFLAKPHADLGRTGPVCPFIPRALDETTLWIRVVDVDPSDPAEMETTVALYRSAFLDLEPKQGNETIFKTIILIFPRVTDAQAPTLIDGVQQKLKPEFVDDGLMLGQFHMKNEEPGLHNEKFRPLRSPIPLLAIRFMVMQDLPFLTRQADPPKLRLRFIKGYLKAAKQQQGSTKADKQNTEVIVALEMIVADLEKAVQEP